ncbi:MAG: glycosyltransferase family 2 protein [Candidatus Omnitrophica bacterium]|nr:glycosyltransferase family 2 protein [Candidatus Omnitrophota bacterium]
MKLIIQIPCYNEEETLPLVLRDLPKKIDGVDKIEILVINDGSTDKTVEVARSLGVHHIFILPKQRGLAYVFKTGLEKALELGADIIVNTDGDNQYKGECIKDLIYPIIKQNAQIVIGCRNISEIKHFSFIKKCLQYLGSHIIRKISNTDIPDTTSGFRAYSREAAMRINIFSDYTYTLETIIQAGRNNLHIAFVKIATNPKLRESRLIKSTFRYLVRSAATALRIYLMYEPLRTFFFIGIFPIVGGGIFIVRFLIDHFTRPSGGHIQSLIIAAIAIIMGFVTIMIGLLGDIISANRKLNEEILYKLKKENLKM